MPLLFGNTAEDFFLLDFYFYRGDVSSSLDVYSLFKIRFGGLDLARLFFEDSCRELAFYFGLTFV